MRAYRDGSLVSVRSKGRITNFGIIHRVKDTEMWCFFWSKTGRGLAQHTDTDVEHWQEGGNVTSLAVERF